LEDLGTRELVEPALDRGLVNFVSEYQGCALAVLSLGKATPTPDVDATHRALVAAVDGRDVVALSPSPAQNGNAIVVTRRTAQRYKLRTISELPRAAPMLRLGGPPECPERP